MAKRDPFRVGIVLGPQNGVHSLGVTHGDWDKGCEFLQSARPLITDFVDQFKRPTPNGLKNPSPLTRRQNGEQSIK